MRDIFFIDKMLTSKLITFVYWILLVSAVVSGLSTMFGGYGGISFSNLLIGIAIIIVGAVGARIGCELMIVLFKIHENIMKIADKEA